jgi:hypothetical protein
MKERNLKKWNRKEIRRNEDRKEIRIMRIMLCGWGFLDRN